MLAQKPLCSQCVSVCSCSLAWSREHLDTIDENCIEVGATLDVPVPDEWTCRVKRKLKARNMNNVYNCRSCVGSTEEEGTTVNIGSRSPTFAIAVIIELDK